MIPKVLTIAGSDSSGGAGVQADLKTFSALGVYGMSVITALTAQNTTGVQGVYPVSADFLELQLRSVFDDVDVSAVKIGMLGDVDSIEMLARLLAEYKPSNIVLDPVMVSQSGHRLIDDASVRALKDHLLPLADLITPNLPEADVLLGREHEDQLHAAQDLLQIGAKAVLLKGGHGKGHMSLDVLAYADEEEVFEAPRHETQNTHGTGCTLSSAIAAFLARGMDLSIAVGEAKSYITEAISHADALDVGKGAGPVHHFYKLWKEQ